MSGTAATTSRDLVRTDGEWWVLVVTDGFTIESPPELYRDHGLAHGEAERWARVLSRRSRAAIERPFEDRWQIGDEWIRLTHTSLPEEGPEIWVLTYWTRDGYPEPEAELVTDAAEARAWVREARVGAVLLESHDTPWSAAARFRVRGGEEEAEAHRAKVVAQPSVATAAVASGDDIFGYEISEGLIPQGPVLFASSDSRDEDHRLTLAREISHRDWKDFVAATAESNYVEGDLPDGWHDLWSEDQAIDWLLGFDYVTNGDSFELRRFETSLNS
jgi:hypothetical protein